MPSSRGSSWPRDWTQVSCIAGRFFTIWATPLWCMEHTELLNLKWLNLCYVNFTSVKVTYSTLAIQQSNSAKPFTVQSDSSFCPRPLVFWAYRHFNTSPQPPFLHGRCCMQLFFYLNRSFSLLARKNLPFSFSELHSQRNYFLSS